MNDTTNNPGRRRKPRGRKAIIAAAVIVLAGGGWYGWHMYQASKDKEGDYIFATVGKGDIEDLVTSTGTLQPRDYVDVGAQVSGQIKKINVDVGDLVTKGQALVEIDAETSQAQMDSSRASLESARNTLLTQIDNLEKAKRDVERQRNLYAQDATTKQSLLDAETAYKNAERQKTNSELTIKQQEASMRINEKNLAYTTIQAPIDGTVMSIAVKLGQTVNASQAVPNVLRIANLNTMTVQSDVSEADVSKLYKGISVYFTTLGGNNRRWYGELKRIEPTPKVQNSVVLYNALFDVQNDGSSLMPSMTAQVYFVSAQANNVVMVPMAAIEQGRQIQRELQQKEREKNGDKAGPAGGPGAPGAVPGVPPVAAGAAAASTTAPGGAAREGAATVAANTPALGTESKPAAGSAPVAGAQAQGTQANRPNGQGTRPGNIQGNRPGGAAQGNGQGMRAGQPGGNFNGPRPGGANGQGGFNPNMTPEQREQMIARFRAQGGGGNFNGQRPGGAGNFNGQRPGGNFNGQRPGGAAANAGSAAGPRPVQRRNGTVMVKKADGTLEARRIVYGVTDRVHGEVIEGLKEGEEVVVGKREKEAAPAASTPRNNNNNNNNNRPNNFNGGGNFPGGGGGGRPF